MKKQNYFVNSDKTVTSLLVIKYSKHNCLLCSVTNTFLMVFFQGLEMTGDFTFSADVYLVFN